MKVEDGKLKMTTVLGDIYTNSDPAATRNFILQQPTKEDYVLETKVDVTQLNGGYAQGGILVRADDDNYVKFDAISDVDNPKFNRIELRSEQAGTIQNPQPEVNSGFPTTVNDVWLRLTKTGTTYKGEWSLDGSTWTAMAATVTNTHDQRAVRPLHARRADRRSRRRLRVLQGRRLDGLPAHGAGEQRAGRSAS